MSPSKDEIRAWLLSHGRDREWLAAQCGVAIGTVHNWFSNRPISDGALATIRLLMERDATSSVSVDVHSALGTLAFTADEFEQLERARALVGSPPRLKFYRDALMQYIARLEQEAAVATGADATAMPVLPAPALSSSQTREA